MLGPWLLILLRHVVIRRFRLGGCLTACQTARVAYHEAFWVVVGTAAPVIALASAVVYNRAPAVMADATKRRRETGHDAGVARFAFAVGMMVSGCLVSQVVAFGAALLCLARETDISSPVTIGVVQLGGFVLLLLPVGLAINVAEGRMRRWAKPTSDERRSAPSREGL